MRACTLVWLDTREAVIGSVARNVLRHAPRSVLVVREGPLQAE